MLSQMPVLSNKAIENSLFNISLTIIYYTRELAILQQVMCRIRTERENGYLMVISIHQIQSLEIYDKDNTKQTRFQVDYLCLP